MPAKKPLTFSLDAAAQPATTAPARAPKAALAPAEEERKQVGARIPATLYRRLKAEAALSGQAVQIHVETAIAEYLERRKQ